MTDKIIIGPDKIGKIYQRQARYLVDHCYDHLAGDNQEIFLKGLDEIALKLAKFEYLRFNSGNIPLLTVISRRLIGLNQQMKNIRIGGQPGSSKFLGYYKFKGPKPHKLIYPIFNVNPGHSVDCSAASGRMLLRIDARAGLLIEEGIALIRHYTHVLPAKSLYLIGSMKGWHGPVPTLITDANTGGARLTITQGVARLFYGIPSHDLCETAFD